MKEYAPKAMISGITVPSGSNPLEGGTGLCLAIVKHLVLAHGGKVWAESRPGEGSTFYVLLPLKPTSQRSVS